MAGLEDLIGKAASDPAAEQLFLWGVLYTLLQSVFQPVLTNVQQEMWSLAVKAGLSQRITPDLLAVMVVRGWVDPDAAATTAADSGINAHDFNLMVENARNPISPEEAAVALRRQIIPEDAEPGTPSFLNAIRQGNLGDQWAPVIKALAKGIPTPADVLQATLEGQIPAGFDARKLYEAVGGDLGGENGLPDWFTFMFNTRGNAPTPVEALQLVNRGIIPAGPVDQLSAGVEQPSGPDIGPGAVSYAQAFLEGPWRNKWAGPMFALRTYVPPPRSIATLQSHGVIDAATAAKMYQANGLTPEDAAIYARSAVATRVAGHTALTEAQVLKLYHDRLVDTAEAITMLANLNIPADVANYLLQLQDFARVASAYERAVTRVGTLYTSHKITRDSAVATLTQMDVPAEARTHLLTTWDMEAAANVRPLTEAQVAAAYAYGVMDQATAQSKLEALGYTPYDAWVVLSVRAHGPLNNQPPDEVGAGVGVPTT